MKGNDSCYQYSVSSIGLRGSEVLRNEPLARAAAHSLLQIGVRYEVPSSLPLVSPGNAGVLAGINPATWPQVGALKGAGEDAGAPRNE